MRLVLAAFAALVLNACTNGQAADTHDQPCSCVKLSEVKKFQTRYCPNEFPLFQGYYLEKDGIAYAYCYKLESGTCTAPEVTK